MPWFESLTPLQTLLTVASCRVADIIEVIEVAECACIETAGHENRAWVDHNANRIRDPVDGTLEDVIISSEWSPVEKSVCNNAPSVGGIKNGVTGSDGRPTLTLQCFSQRTGSMTMVESSPGYKETTRSNAPESYLSIGFASVEE